MLFVKQWVSTTAKHFPTATTVLVLKEQSIDADNSLRELLGVIMSEIDCDLYAKVSKVGITKLSKGEEKRVKKTSKWKPTPAALPVEDRLIGYLQKP
jgi:hypothetical protein